MKREFLLTKDGSYTIHIPEWNEQYHSKNGAIAEAVHVFIEAGLLYYLEQHKVKKLRIMEIGFGTGLNAMLTQIHCKDAQFEVDYTSIEAYPVTLEEAEQLNYCELLNFPKDEFIKMHEQSWEVEHRNSKLFTLRKLKKSFLDITASGAFHLIYFDAFGPRVQPELWTEEIFDIMHRALLPGGVLVTYSAKGSVRRNMEAAGFEVERLPGPPGKREMLRAVKN